MKERLKNLFSFNIAKRIALPFFIILLMMAVTISLTTKSYYAQINNYSYQREEASKQGVAANLRFGIATLIMHVHDYLITEKVDYNHKFELQRTQVEDYQKKLLAFKLSKEELIIINTIVADLDSVYLYSNRIFAIQHPGSSLDATKLMEIMDDNFEAPLYRNITKIFNLSSHKIEILTSQNTQMGKEMKNYRYIVFALSLLISLGIVYISIQKISKPIRALTKAAEAITKGNYALRPKVLSRDEIGSLALSFSQMAETVQEKINKLKESEEQYEHLFETTSDLIQTMDADGKILFVNRAWREKLGYTKENLTNLKLEDIIQRDLFSKCDVTFQNALEGQRTDNLEIKLIKHDGEIIDVEGNVFCNRKEGMPSMVACFLRDVTEQKKAEDQLKFHANLLNEIDEAVIATSHNGDITYWNKAAEKLYGWNETEVMGRNILDVAQPSVTNKDIALTMASLDNGESWSGEFLCQRKNGSTFPAIVFNSPILDAHGKLIGIISISSDITKRKQKENELLLAKEKAEESDKLKTAFINNISHEIRTPLNGILGFGQVWVDSGLSREKREKYFLVIKQSSNRLMQTVTDYMDIAMIVSGTLEVHKKEFQMKPLLEEIMENTKMLCFKKPIEIEVEVPSNSDLLRLDSDRELIRKIIKNLIDNAVKFTDKGKIIVGYRILEGHLEFFVKDTGRGIEQDKLQKIFEVFTQDDISMTRGYEGSGLGLAIAKGFVASLNGDIWATSNDGKGSVFYFTIPYNSNILTVLNEKKLTPAFNKPKSDNKPLILVAEDDELNFLFIKELLEMAGCDYLHAINGKEAVEICKQNLDISFVLMDIKMPVMNGLEATRFIKEFRPNLPIIAVTAYSLTGDEHRFMEAGCDEYYSKPIKEEILDKLIKKYITG